MARNRVFHNLGATNETTGRERSTPEAERPEKEAGCVLSPPLAPLQLLLQPALVDDARHEAEWNAFVLVHLRLMPARQRCTLERFAKRVARRYAPHACGTIRDSANWPWREQQSPAVSLESSL